MSPPSPQASIAKGCTLKALGTGLLGAAAIGLGSNYNDMIIKGSGLAVWNLTPAAIFVFFVLVVIINSLLRLIHPRLPLQRGELAVAFFIILLANTLSSRGLPAQLLPVITGAYYYATPENNWAETVHPYMPAWPIPQGQGVIWDFYEGSAAGQVPWSAWAGPLLHWAVFGMAFFLVMLCTMVIVRRQWVEHERLSYPMVQLPLAMITEDSRGGFFRPLFRSPLMWLGFAVPFILASVNALHNYFGVFPFISLSQSGIPLLRGMASVRIYLNLSMLGFSYFIPQNVALGLTFFHWLNLLQQGFLGLFAWGGKDETMGAYSLYTDSVIIHQAMGGMVVLVLGSLWVGRSHLAAVCRKAFRGAPEVDDSDEIMSYRTAVWGTLLGFAAMTIWLWQTGIPLPLVPLLLFGAFVGFFTMARVAAQGGVAAMFPPTNGPDFAVSAIGGSLLGTKGMAGMALSYAWSVDTLILFMTACANGLKLVSEVVVSRHRRLFGGIVATIALTLACAVGLTLYLGYQHGAINLSGFYFNNVAQYPYRFMEKSIQDPQGIGLDAWLHLGVGGLIMGVLMLAQYRFLWWPFHALGFPISCVFGKMWFSVFCAWLLKSAILKYGGIRLFNQLKPFFLGLILGEAVVAGTWVIIDYLAGVHHNYLGGIVFQ
ncbi:MAG: hypothetical protein GKR89_30180 [Candidatus Latescibacteria bacterium]|nr:hypothetical protein [Candidatus Latescibacterota bacterium]